ncbi:cysteine synthase A [Limosilactobacillus mucosae]|uniref:Cysteine synthase n=1 Tax=Limosilactobacillus mucosae TaxID=97478 RepID=A0AAJ1HT31_LIMMU|nr:cysteine synthase A [Limosilactobacillus mucosae]MDD6892932.1 cysteine synthase A [Lactobacillus sp.]MDC2830236.1 cysteine synthase A [Limosilactobacillus mucosae]MDC2837808.1 cysteine synthase A [Limosilactobacillus mucosae]MDC2839221.1 cysteine synthase A [Limosilactobacillus mucosae]MDC2849823.1 cysteine synthase A [Limosilactobacillus mucosae]
MSKIYTSIDQLIGNTPLLKLNRIVPEDAADVYVKLEFFNPAGSIKDRIALAMIEKAEQEGQLKPGDTIIEPTSGNTGIGLASVAAAKGYHLIIVMPETMSVERRKLMQGYGAELILTPGAEGMKGSIAKAQELVDAKGYFMPMQFENPANPAIHEATTGQEIIDAFGKDNLPDAFVAGVGTGGTLSGIGHALKQADPSIKVYALEPAESPVLKEGKAGKHKIQGISAGFIPKTLDQDVYDGIIEVTSDDAIKTAQEVGHLEGFLPGISAGANIYGAIELAKKLGKGKKVVTVAPDGGDRYLSTELFDY